MRQNSSPEAESLVLSGMAATKWGLCLGIENTSIEDFCSVLHQTIYQELVEIYKAGWDPSSQKIILSLSEKNLLNDMGGARGVMEVLGGYVTGSDDMLYYIAILKDCSRFRRLELANIKLSNFLDANPRMPSENILTAVRQEIDAVESGRSLDIGMDVGLSLPDRITAMQDMAKSIANGTSKPDSSPRSGIEGLDGIVGGLEGGYLVTIGARTGMGKTALALNMALNMVKQGKPIYFFSLEMSYKEILERILSQSSGILHKKIHACSLSDEEIGEIRDSTKYIDKGMLFIDDKSGIKIDEIVSISKRAKESYNISAIFIDYIQLIISKEKNEYRHLEIARYTSALKTLAKTLNIPVIILAQLSRKCDERTDHRPALSDLREAGAIEQDSDIVITIYRRDYYDHYDRPGEATIAVVKNRHGETGEARVKNLKDIGKFISL